MIMSNCIDSNILIYAFERSSEYFEKSKNLLFDLSNKGKLYICDVSLIEFFQVITNSKKFSKPLSPKEALSIIHEIVYGDSFIILYSNEEILKNAFQNILEYKVIKYGIYDHLIAMILKNNNISDFFTVNDKDFRKYNFLNVINPFI
jgi:predicted nucleic acid-binding protein